MRITLSLSTRERAHLLAETIGRTLENITLPGTTLLVNVDDDDPQSYAEAMKFFPDIAVCTRPREDTTGEKWNRAITIAPADVYVIMVDYAPILTRGFDEKIAESATVYPDGIALVRGNLANLTFPSLQAPTAKLVEKMGFIYPPYFPYWFTDHWLQDVAQMIGREVYADVKVDCVTRRPPKTLELRDLPFWTTLYDALYPLRHKCVHDIVSSPEFEETPARKRALLQNIPCKEQHSHILNGMVAAGAEGIEQSRGGTPIDERYIRTKKNAQALLRTVIPFIEAAQAAA